MSVFLSRDFDSICQLHIPCNNLKTPRVLLHGNTYFPAFLAEVRPQMKAGTLDCSKIKKQLSVRGAVELFQADSLMSSFDILRSKAGSKHILDPLLIYGKRLLPFLKIHFAKFTYPIHTLSFPYTSLHFLLTHKGSKVIKIKFILYGLVN